MSSSDSSIAHLTVSARDTNWTDRVLALLRETGFAIVPDIVSEDERARTREGLARVKAAQRQEFPDDTLHGARASDDRELRLLFKYDPFFYRFLEYPALLSVIDAFLSPSAILRFQQSGCLIGGPDPRRPGPWHMNFRRVLNGYPAALEVGFVIDGVDPGSYYFALGSQQQSRPDDEALTRMARTFPLPPGAMFFFDGTLWHYEGETDPVVDRHLVMHQFVPHFIKPHIDYVRAVGAPAMTALSPRTRRLLGWESRVPASLDEFYAAPAERFYLPGQG